MTRKRDSVLVLINIGTSQLSDSTFSIIDVYDHFLFALNFLLIGNVFGIHNLVLLANRRNKMGPYLTASIHQSGCME